MASLIVIAIIAVLAVVVLRGSGMMGSEQGAEKARPDGRGATMPGLVKASAEDTVCRSYLSQLRMSIGMARTTNDTPPATLEDTRLGDQFYKCPLGGERYQYNPSTGEVFCPHLGHEKY